MGKNIIIALLCVLLFWLGWRQYDLGQKLGDRELSLSNCLDAGTLLPAADSLLWLGRGDAARALFAENPSREPYLQRLLFWEGRLAQHRFALDSLHLLRDSLQGLAARQGAGIASLQRQLRQLNAGLEQEEQRGLRLMDSIQIIVQKYALDSSDWRGVIEDNRMLEDSLRSMIADLEVRLANRKYLRWKSPKGVDIIYIGDTDGEQPHGQGTGIWKNGTYYEGDWKKGEKHGQGMYQFPQGEHYEGAFLHNQRDGYGIYYWKNGDVYSGWWKNDLRDGEGVIRNKDGKIVKRGIWKEDKILRSTEVPEGH